MLNMLTFKRNLLFVGSLALMLTVSACNGQLVMERVVTATPDPNVILITITPEGGEGTAAAVVAVTATPTAAGAVIASAPTAATTATLVAAGSIINATNTPVPPTPTLSPFPTETRQEIFIAQQSFEKGYMFWIQARGIVWVLIVNPTNPNVGEWYVYQDTFDEAVDKEDESIVAPDGNYAPKRGFGKLWRTTPGLRDALGWGITPEFGLNTDYRYQPGGYLDPKNTYVPGPGTHFITTLGKEVFALSEPDATGIARWQRVN